MKTPKLYKNKLIFPPIGSANQLTDILGLTEPEKALIASKIDHTRDNIKAIVKINDTKIYYPEFGSDSIFYQLSPDPCSPQYYYPIQYAKIEFKLKQTL